MRRGKGSPGVRPAFVAACFAALVLVVAGGAGAAPSNDSFSAAQVIGGWSGSVTGSTVGATFQVGEPRHDSGRGRRLLEQRGSLRVRVIVAWQHDGRTRTTSRPLKLRLLQRR